MTYTVVVVVFLAFVVVEYKVISCCQKGELRKVEHRNC